MQNPLIHNGKAILYNCVVTLQDSVLGYNSMEYQLHDTVPFSVGDDVCNIRGCVMNG